MRANEIVCTFLYRFMVERWWFLVRFFLAIFCFFHLLSLKDYFSQIAWLTFLSSSPNITWQTNKNRIFSSTLLNDLTILTNKPRKCTDERYKRARMENVCSISKRNLKQIYFLFFPLRLIAFCSQADSNTRNAMVLNQIFFSKPLLIAVKWEISKKNEKHTQKQTQTHTEWWIDLSIEMKTDAWA